MPNLANESQRIASTIHNRARSRLISAYLPEYHYLKKVAIDKLFVDEEYDTKYRVHESRVRSIAVQALVRRRVIEFEIIKDQVQREVYEEFNYSPKKAGGRDSKYEDLIEHLAGLEIPTESDG